MNTNQLYRFLSALRICRENLEPVFEEIVSSEIKALDVMYNAKIEEVSMEYKKNYKIQQRKLDVVYKARSKDRNRVKKRYDDFLYTCKGIDDAITAQNNETLNNITDLFRKYLDENIKINDL